MPTNWGDRNFERGRGRRLCESVAEYLPRSMEDGPETVTLGYLAGVTFGMVGKVLGAADCSIAIHRRLSSEKPNFPAPDASIDCTPAQDERNNDKED